MVTVKIEKRYGAATIRSSITARSIARALEIAGPGAKVLFPLDPDSFFAPAGAVGAEAPFQALAEGSVPLAVAA